MIRYFLSCCCPIKQPFNLVKECPICLDTKPLIRLKKCKHDFCVDCITEWFVTTLSATPTCPICRENVDFAKKTFRNYYTIEVI